MSTPTGKTYPIKTIADLVRIVTLDNMDTLSKDVAYFIRSAAGAKAIFEAAGGEPGGLRCTSFDWTDDGARKVTTGIYLNDSETPTIQTILKPNDQPGD